MCIGTMWTREIKIRLRNKQIERAGKSSYCLSLERKRPVPFSAVLSARLGAKIAKRKRMQ